VPRAGRGGGGRGGSAPPEKTGKDDAAHLGGEALALGE